MKDPSVFGKSRRRYFVVSDGKSVGVVESVDVVFDVCCVWCVVCGVLCVW